MMLICFINLGFKAFLDCYALLTSQSIPVVLDKIVYLSPNMSIAFLKLCIFHLYIVILESLSHYIPSLANIQKTANNKHTKRLVKLRKKSVCAQFYTVSLLRARALLLFFFLTYVYKCHMCDLYFMSSQFSSSKLGQQLAQFNFIASKVDEKYTENSKL